MTAFLKLFRFPLIFTAIADSAAGYLLACRESAPEGLVLLYLAIASGGMYCFGMAMNDLVDRRRDRELHPERVLPSGRMTLRGAAGAAVFVLALSAAATLLISAAHPGRFAAWGALLAAVLAYNFALRFAPVMGLARCFNFLLGALSAPWAWDVEAYGSSGVFHFAFALFVYVTALTFVSTFEEGKRARWMLAAAVGAMGAGAALPAVFGPMTRAEGWFAGAVAAALLAAWLLGRAFLARDRRGVMLLVRDGVAGIIVVDATMLLSSGLLVPGLCVAALLVPAAACVALFKRLS